MNIFELYKTELERIKNGQYKFEPSLTIEEYNKYVYKLFNDQTKNKNEKGLTNELLISGNLHRSGYNTIVLNDRNKDYDISISKDGKENFIECKFDNLAHKTNNFYFEC